MLEANTQPQVNLFLGNGPLISAPQLLLDIGNSSVITAVYKNHKITKIRKISTTKFVSILPTLQLEQFQRIVASSVVPKIDQQLKAWPQVLLLNHNNLPLLKNNLKKPKQAGADRLVNALAAYSLFQRSCLIIDAGTAITFCYINQQGEYQGGGIFPGMKIASQALSQFTAKVPCIWVRPHVPLIGKTTREAVQSALYHGYLHLINGMIDEYRREIGGDLWVVGTGNGLTVLKNRLKLDAWVPNLILQGLAYCASSLPAGIR